MTDVWRAVQTDTGIAQVQNPTDLPIVAIRDSQGKSVEADIAYHEDYVVITFGGRFVGEVAFGVAT